MTARSSSRAIHPAWLAAAFAMLPGFASADEISSGDTAWMLTATALVLFMTIPGLALFYAGLVRSKNALSVMMQCFALTAAMTILWVICGYSLAFGGDGGKFLGGFDRLFLKGLTVDSVKGSIPESVWIMFQMTFAVITPALIAGAYAERMKFSAVLMFSSLWLVFVYAPVCHWVWAPGGWLYEMGVLDFAGGTVVHINAGISALVVALVLGPRKGYPRTMMPPHNLMFTVIGASMLWVGWFGFNAGSQLAADGTAGMAMLVTQISSAAAALTWMFIEWMKHGKPSVLGIATGAVAGLVAITPASGTAGPAGAIVIGVVSGAACFWSATVMKRRFGYDDSLDAFGVHGVGGFIGAMLTGVFAAESLGGSVVDLAIGTQLGKQFIGASATLVYAGVLSFVILMFTQAVVGLRVSPDQETEGLDITLHDEKGYDL